MMSDSAEFTRDVCAYWNSRAGMGQWAGTKDVIAKQLEVEAIAAYVHDGLSILEVGCGNGITAIELARRHNVEIIGIDYAEAMIAAARDMIAGQSLRGSVDFRVGDAQSLTRFTRKFDLIYTERVLINLPDWKSQREAIRGITDLLAPGGAFVMCENSQDGLDAINELRQRVGLPEITPPWHNRYFRDAEIGELNFPGVVLETVNCYSSTYYFLSRVINAVLAAREQKEPEYDAWINRLALRLPPVGNLGQGRIWLWRKSAESAQLGGIAGEQAS